MVTKTFFKSRNITLFKRLLSIFHSHSFVASSKAVLVEKIGLKPDFDSVNKLLLFRYLHSLLKTTLSINLLTTGRKRTWSVFLLCFILFCFVLFFSFSQPLVRL